MEELESIKIVFVDDEKDYLRSCLMLYGEYYGHDRVFGAVNFEKAMDIVRELDEVAIFFIDINLGGAYMGLSLVRNIRHTARVPVKCYCISGDGSSRTKLRALSTGADGYMVKPVEPDEVHGYVISGKRGLEEALNASRDPLTGLLNRRGMSNACLREFSRIKRHGNMISCLYMDIDQFKKLNDVYGHDVGDKALQALAECFRDHHIWRITDVVCRSGGDEFIILLPEVNNQEALFVASSLREAVSDLSVQTKDGKEVKFHASVGAGTLLATDIGSDYAECLAQLVRTSEEEMRVFKTLHSK